MMSHASNSEYNGGYWLNHVWAWITHSRFHVHDLCLVHIQYSGLLTHPLSHEHRLTYQRSASPHDEPARGSQQGAAALLLRPLLG